MEIWINSFGGCRSNYLCKCLETKYKVFDEFWWQRGCHSIEPTNHKSVKLGVFCYVSDIGIALTSQLKQGWNPTNYYKCIGNTKDEFNIENWLTVIDKQIDNWTKPNPWFDVLLINTDHFDPDFCKTVFQLNDELPLFQKRSTTEYNEMLIPHIKMIEMINEKLYRLQNLKIIKKKKKI